MKAPENRIFYLIAAICIILISEKISGCNSPEPNQSNYSDSVKTAHEFKSKQFSDSIDSAIAIQMKFSKDFDSITVSEK